MNNVITLKQRCTKLCKCCKELEELKQTMDFTSNLEDSNYKEWVEPNFIYKGRIYEKFTVKELGSLSELTNLEQNSKILELAEKKGLLEFTPNKDIEIIIKKMVR